MASFSEYLEGVGDRISSFWNDKIVPIGQGIKNWYNDTSTKIANLFNKEVNPVVQPITQGITNKVSEYLPEPDEKAKKKLSEIGASNLPESWQYDESSSASSNKSSDTTELKESLLNDQKELWEREDAIRKHVEEREDSAYQRAVADMKKAGINPELLGVNPANSGGGITSASRLDNSLLNTDLSGAYSELIAQLNNNVKVDENQKDRILSIVNNFVDLAGRILMFKYLKK